MRANSSLIVLISCVARVAISPYATLWSATIGSRCDRSLVSFSVRPLTDISTCFSARLGSGSGHLDGLAYGSPGNQRMVMVTTDGLLKSWLTLHKTWWGKDEEKMPQTPAAALKTEGFYTQAIGFDAA